MITGKFLVAVVVITIAITFIQWLFVGYLFHKYQALTPSTWRKESYRSYAASMFLTLIFASFFTAIFWAWRQAHGPVDALGGMEFGLVLWFAFSVTQELGSAIYVQLSRMFVLGKCLSALVEYVLAGLLAATLS
jgi:hypothetical protein